MKNNPYPSTADHRDADCWFQALDQRRVVTAPESWDIKDTSVEAALEAVATAAQHDRPIASAIRD